MSGETRKRLALLKKSLKHQLEVDLREIFNVGRDSEAAEAITYGQTWIKKTEKILLEIEEYKTFFKELAERDPGEQKRFEEWFTGTDGLNERMRNANNKIATTLMAINLITSPTGEKSKEPPRRRSDDKGESKRRA